jgi:DUF4097 and DUF4098 domain-containing protein YvlB
MTHRIASCAVLLLAFAPAVAAKDFEDRITAKPGGQLRVDLKGGTVEVESHDDNEVRVDANVRGMGSGAMKFELGGDGVDVDFSADLRAWAGVFGGPRVRVRLRVPERYDVDIRTGGGDVDLQEIRGEVKARTSGGSIEVDEIEGPVFLWTSGGSIEAKEIRGNLEARTSGGRIRAAEVTGNVEAHTSGGPIKVTDVEGAVDLHTSGGEISVRFTDAPEGVLETSGGGLEVEFPEDVGANLDAKTSGGRVDVEHSIRVRGGQDPQHVVGEVNGGGRTLLLRTSGGDIRVRIR